MKVRETKINFNKTNTKNEGDLDYFTKQILHYEFKDKEKSDKLKKKGKRTILAIHYCRVIFHNLWYSIFINFCIVYALFANYLNIIIFDNRVDVIFSAITIFVFVVFIFDFCIYLRGKREN